jgi:hypothetical protein
LSAGVGEVLHRIVQEGRELVVANLKAADAKVVCRTAGLDVIGGDERKIDGRRLAACGGARR